MLKALYDYAAAHPDIVLPPGYAEASIDFIVCVRPDGHISDVMDVRTDGRGVKFIRPVRNGARNDDPFVRKAEVLMSEDSRKLQDMAAEFRSCACPELDGIRTMFDRYAGELVEAVSAKCAGVPKANVGFSVLDGSSVETYVWDVPAVRGWWSASYCEENRSDRACLDLFTGEPCTAAKLIKNTSVKAAAGGQTSGSNLISFNADAFSSYGFSQGANMPAGMRTLSMAIDAYNHLAVHGVRLADMRLVCWCSGLDAEQSDMFDDVFRFDFSSLDRGASDEDIDAASRRIRDILASPVSTSAYGSLDKGMYHVLVTKADAARISVLYYASGRCSDLLDNYRRWHDAMDILNISGSRRMPQRNAYKLIFAATSLRDRKMSDVFVKHRKFVKPVVQSCMQGRPLPDDMLAMAVRAFKSAFHPPQGEKADIGRFGSTVQLISLCLTIGKEGNNMPVKDDMNGSDAYLCGRLFSVHEWFYGVAVRDSDVMTERFVACCQKPAAQIKKIQMLCAHRMRDVRWHAAKRLFQSECEAIFGLLGTIPVGLDVHRQAEFILGYWHEKGRITKLMEPPAGSGASNTDMEGDNDD